MKKLSLILGILITIPCAIVLLMSIACIIYGAGVGAVEQFKGVDILYQKGFETFLLGLITSIAMVMVSLVSISLIAYGKTKEE